MRRVLCDFNVCDVCLDHYKEKRKVSGFESSRSAHSSLLRLCLAARVGSLLEPSGSFLLKQLSMMRRFSSSNLSALLAAAPRPVPFARSISRY